MENRDSVRGGRAPKPEPKGEPFLINKILETSLMGLGIVVLLLVGAIATFLLAGIAPIVAGYEAKMLCSHLFVSQRKIEPVLASDLEPFNPLLGFVKAIPSRELVVDDWD